MNALANYDAACHALQQAASVDEVLTIRDQAEAMRAYGRQAKNRELETYAQEIRLRAERKLGALIVQQKQSVGMAPAGRPSKSVVADDQLSKVPTLAEMGISKDLSSRAQKLAAVPDAEFEDHIAEHKQRVAAENARVVNKLESVGNAALKGKKTVAATEDGLHEEIDALKAHVEKLSEHIEELAGHLKSTLDENETLLRVVEADDQVAAALAEVARQKAIATNAERTLVAKAGEYIERAKSVSYWQRRAEKAEKQLASLGATV